MKYDNRGCKIPGCNGLGHLCPNGQRTFTKGYCQAHYKRLIRYGSPIAKGVNGRSKMRTYGIWQHMKDRCYNHKCAKYHLYGGRGIKVCDRWLEKNGKGFENFLKDLGEVPTDMSLDRIDVNGDYTPKNCRWANKWTQAWNRNPKSISGIRGVYYNKKTGYYHATIRINHKARTRYFRNIESAIAQRKEWEGEVNGI